MAAVTGYIETQSPAEEQRARRAARGLAGGAGLGALGVSRGTQAPPLEHTHAELTAFLAVRAALEIELARRHLQVETVGRKVVIRLVDGDGKAYPLERDAVPWSSLAVPRLTAVNILGRAGKMACPTFDLPAGAASVGGACPGATAAQTTVPAAKRAKALVGGAVGAGGVTGVVPNSEQFYKKALELDARETICQRCVAGDTRVFVRGEGLVRIDELAARVTEFEVWSGHAWRKTKAVCNGVRPTLRLRVNWGPEVRLTGDHDVITLDRGRVRADELEAGDRLKSEQPQCVNADDAPPAEIEAPPPGQRYRTAVIEDFPRRWNRDVGVFLGVVLADGSISHGSGYPTINVSEGEEDIDIVEALRDIVASWCSSTAAVRVAVPKPQENGLIDWEHLEAKPMAHIGWRMRGLYEFTRACGLDKSIDSADRRVPSGLWTAGVEAVAGFLAGYFAADGSVTVSSGGKVEITAASVSIGLLRDVQLLLAGYFGIRSTLCEYKSSNVWRAENGYRNLHKLSIGAVEHSRLFRDRIGLASKRKMAKLETALAAMEGRGGCPRHPIVTAVEPSGVEEPVYDLLNVGEEHQFVANGISVSNCYATSGQYESPHVQAGEMIHYAWVRECLSRDVEEFIAVMVRAVQGADFRQERHVDPRTGVMLRPFRIHSSGDFFSQEYARAWVEIANRTPDVTYWAPTRTWAVQGWGRDFWADLLKRNTARNLNVRASAYHFSDYAPGVLARRPAGPGNAAGSTSVYAGDKGAVERGVPVADKRYDWDCQAYAVDRADKTCLNAMAPDGEVQCRACWIKPGLRVNYTAH